MYSHKFIISLVIVNLVNLIYSAQLDESLISSNRSLDKTNSTLIEILKSADATSPASGSKVSTSSLSSTTETTATNELNKLEAITTIKPTVVNHSTSSETDNLKQTKSNVKIVSTSSQYSVSSSVSSISTSASWPRKVTKKCSKFFLVN